MAEQFDVFLSHNSRDKSAVIALAKKLKAKGLKVWLDAWELRPGQPWQEALEQIIETTKSAAVLVGDDGFGPWQSREMRGCLSEFAEKGKAVIPVLLPSCPSEVPKLPFFLKQLTWVDLRDGKEEVGFYHLIWGITGEKPKELDEAADNLAAEVISSGLPVRPEPFTGRKNITRIRQPRPKPTRRAQPEESTASQFIGNTTIIQLPQHDAATTTHAGAKLTIPHIHGWPTGQVQELKREAAQSLGVPTTFRDTLQAGGEGPLMAVIPAGSFLMGSPDDEPERSDDDDEGPQHKVSFAQPFAIGVYAVTFDEYDHYCKATGKSLENDSGWGRGRQPVIYISWEDAVAYCAWLSGQTGKHYRLPSEAEWEYACRAGMDTQFHFGSTITPKQANYDGNYAYNGGVKGEYREKTVPVDEFHPNAFGLYQMHGNVWEWCEDGWHDNYKRAPEDGSAWIEGGGRRVIRGGSWFGRPADLRSADRFWYFPGTRYSLLGFRLAQDL